MLQSPYFVQECPVCGRPLQVRVAYLGRRVACQHCCGRFKASDPALWRGSASERQPRGLLAQADRLLEFQSRRRVPR